MSANSAAKDSKKTAVGTIEVTSYKPIPYDDSGDGPKLVELQITEIFAGDIRGDGAVRFLQAQRADGSASYCGIERVTGTLDGKSGSFLLQDEGTLQGTHVEGTWFVIANSGTGELSGLRGEGGFEAELGQHASWTLHYWFE